MNEDVEQKTIIENYLMDVRKKLPHWLKDQRKDVPGRGSFIGTRRHADERS